jgi:hypothetical protein
MYPNGRTSVSLIFRSTLQVRCGLLWFNRCTAYQYINPDGETTPPLSLGGGGNVSGPFNPDGTPGAWINSHQHAWDVQTRERYLITDDGWVGPFDDFVSFGGLSSYDLVDGRYFGAVKKGDRQKVFWGRWVSEWHDEVIPIEYGLQTVPFYIYRDGSQWFAVYNPTDPDGIEFYGPFDQIGNHHTFHVQGGEPAFSALSAEGWCGFWGAERDPFCGFDETPGVFYGDGVIFEAPIDGVYTRALLPESPADLVRVHRYPGGEGQAELSNWCEMFRTYLTPDKYSGVCPEDTPEPDDFLVPVPDNP